MHLLDLPNDVLRLVLEESLVNIHNEFEASKTNMMKTLKANLPRLAVCRQLRCLALPIVHSAVFIQHGDMASWRIGPWGHYSHSTDDRPEDVKMTTNLDFAVAAGCVHAVKQVGIYVYCIENPFPGLGAVARLMRTAAERWGGVRRLTISVNPRDSAFRRGKFDPAEYEDDVRRASAALAAAMPAVRSVCFEGYGSDHVSWMVYGELAALYSSQLQRVDARSPVTVPLGCTFEQLRAVSINERGDGFRGQRVDLTSLVSLTLGRWPPDHSWASFGPENGSGALVFPRLKSLDVTYNETSTWDDDTPHPDDDLWELHFPTLDKLKVYCTRDTCLLFERAMFPTHMDSITVYAEVPVLQDISEIGLPAARRLELGPTECEIEGSNALAAISSILEDARGSEEIVLNFHHHCLSPALPGLFTCTSVTDLQIWSGDSVSAILDLVRGLPNLTSLTLTDVESNANFDDVSVPEPGDTCLVEPFDTKLRKVCIYAYCDEQEQVLLIPTVKCLLLRTPTLAVFASGMVPEGPIMDFVDAYSAQYPHLATIAFMFRGDKWGFFGGADLW